MTAKRITFAPVILAGFLLVILTGVLTASPVHAAGLAIGGEIEATAGARVFDSGREDWTTHEYVLRLWVPVAANVRAGAGLICQEDSIYRDAEALLLFLDCEPAEFLAIYIGYESRLARDGNNCDVWVRYEPGLLGRTGIHVRAVYHLDYGLRISGAIGYFEIEEELIGDAWIEPFGDLAVGIRVQYDNLRAMVTPIAFVEYEAFGAVSLRYEWAVQDTWQGHTITIGYTF